MSKSRSCSETSDGSFSQKTDIWGNYGFILTQYHLPQPPAGRQLPHRWNLQESQTFVRDQVQRWADPPWSEEPGTDDTPGDRRRTRTWERFKGANVEKLTPRAAATLGCSSPPGTQQLWDLEEQTPGEQQRQTHASRKQTSTATHPPLGAMTEGPETQTHDIQKNKDLTLTLTNTHRHQPELLGHFTRKENKKKKNKTIWSV